MTIHYSIPAWRIPWTEVPDGLQSMGLERVGYSWSNLARRHALFFHSSRSSSNTLGRATGSATGPEKEVNRVGRRRKKDRHGVREAGDPTSPS